MTPSTRFGHISIRFIRQFWGTLTWEDMRRPVWDEAISLWVASIKKNEKRSDADTLIAAASTLDACVVTDNEKHFVSFGVPIENWAA